MTRNDKTIICKDCGRTFIFRYDEQNYYAEQGYDDPIRCKDCRTAKKTSAPVRQDKPPRTGTSAGSGPRQGFSQPAGSGPRPGYGKPAGSGPRSFGGPKDRTEREPVPVICASCGKQTTVPFKPREGRPVYCSDCFSKYK